MKKFRSFLIVCIVIMGFFVFIYHKSAPTISAHNCEVYFVDKQLHKLIPISIPCEENQKRTAEKIIEEIVEGRDSNQSILRIMPKIDESISVTVSGETAYVNLPEILIESMNKSRDTETLFIYQIVNSLVSVEGIEYVAFTVDGKVVKDFLGFLDLRGLFSADYSV